MRPSVRVGLAVLLGLTIASAASANHDTDCTEAGGTNGPGQLDCSLPEFVAGAGSTEVLSSFFVYTPSTDRDPPTCAVGTLTPMSVDDFVSIDTPVLDASMPPFRQVVQVFVDPSGLAPGVYEGEVRIALTIGTMAPQCPSSPGGLNGIVRVRLVITSPEPAPALAPLGLAGLAAGLGLAGLERLRRSRRR